MVMMASEGAEAMYHLIVIREMPTDDLIEAYRAWPNADTQRELERRGVTLWHHSLRPVA
jgi:hypothetical protein